MAPQVSVSPLTTLKAISFRIQVTPTDQLPHIVHHLSSLAVCKSLLSSEQPHGSEAAVAVHKFRTQLSTLLQDRSIHGRWAAVVLVKGAVEAGGFETIQKSGPWVRGLLNILSKPDPQTTKKLCIITLTRIFTLTREYPTVVREITTPSLTPFITGCLNNIFPKSMASIEYQNPSQRALLYPVLESFHQLIPRHPTIFRTFQSQLQSLVLQCIAFTHSSHEGRNATNVGPLSADTAQAARKVFVDLHYCAPKATGSEEWSQKFTKAVHAAHSVADKVFRAVIEDWRSTAGVTTTTSKAHFDEDVRQTSNDELGLSSWSGIYAGDERLVALLRLLEVFINSPTTSAVNINVGLLFDLLSRLLTLTIPFHHSKDEQGIRLSNQISREERDALWNVLPVIHNAASRLIESVAKEYEESLFSINHFMLDHLIDVFEAERALPSVRACTYKAVKQQLCCIGGTLSKQAINSLRRLMDSCCEDIVESESQAFSGKPSVNGTSKPKANLETSLNMTSKVQSGQGSATVNRHLNDLEISARSLLATYLATVPSDLMPQPLRTKMDRTIILANQTDAMLGSVMNPSSGRRGGKPPASILPLLARQENSQKSLPIEALIRPRMPIIKTGTRTSAAVDEEEDGDEDMIYEEEEEAFLEAAEPEGPSKQRLYDDATLEASHESGRAMIQRMLGQSGPTDQPSHPLEPQEQRRPSTTPETEGPSKQRLYTDETLEASHQSGKSIIEKILGASASSSKREADSDPGRSSPKRARLGDESVPAPAAGITTVPPLPTATEPAEMDVTLPRNATEVINPVVSMAVQGKEKGKAGVNVEEGSDDDDDFGELVMKGDSDEEEE